MRYLLALCGIFFCLSASAEPVSFQIGTVQYAYDSKDVIRQDDNITVFLVSNSPMLNVKHLKGYAAGVLVVTVGCSSNEFILSQVVLMGKDDKPIAKYVFKDGAQPIPAISVPAYLANHLCVKDMI